MNKSLRAQWVTPELPNGILTAFLVSVETFEGGVVKLDPVMVDNMTFSYQLNNSSLGQSALLRSHHHSVF